MYSETALNIALPQLSVAFGVDVSAVQWLVVGYMLVIGVVLPFASLLMKWFSARKLTLFALGAFFVGATMSAAASSFVVALVGRAIQGISTGFILPIMFAMVIEVFPPNKIGAAMGTSALVVMLAAVIGPTLAGALVGAGSWRLVFASFAAINLVGIVFAWKFGVSPYKLSKPAIDAPSVVLSIVGFGGVVLGAGMASTYGWVSPIVLGALVAGVLCLVFYVRRQLSMETPIIDVRVFSYQGFRVGTACVIINFGITLSAMFILPQFYQNSMLLEVAVAGAIMLPGGIVNASVSMISGRIYDRIGARGPALCGFGMSVVGAVALLFTAPESPLAYVVVCHVAMMIGVPLAMSPCQTHALSSLPRNLSTDGSTALNTFQQVFGAVCTAVATSLLTAGQASYVAAGGASSAIAFAQGSHWGFAFTLVLAAVGFALSLRIKVKKRANVGTGQVAAANAVDRAASHATAKTSAAGDAGSDGASANDAAKSGARA